MRDPNRRSARPRTEPRGVVLMICLLLLLIATFLASLLLLLARFEGTFSATSRGSVQASHAAEYGIEFGINSLNTAQPPAPFPDQALAPGVQATAGLRNRSNATPVNVGASPCPAGYSLSLGCVGYTFTATGWARAWLVTIASTQLEESASIYQGCNSTEYSC